MNDEPVVHKPGYHDAPQNQPIEGAVAAYMMDVVEALTELNEKVSHLRWRIHRGDKDALEWLVYDARKTARKLAKHFDMVLHCLERSNR